MANLRILHQNLADSATITASSTAGSTAASNLKSDIKGLIWRSATNAVSSSTAILKVDLLSAKIVTAVILGFTNLAYNSTVTVQGHNSDPAFGGDVNAPTVAAGTILANTASVVPYVQNGLDYWGNNTYSSTISREGYARVYFANSTAYRYYTITITNPDSGIFHYIEASRLIMGNYYSPTYNTGYDGLSSGIVDMSINERTEAGDIFTYSMNTYNTLSFDLKYLTPTDRSVVQRILKNNATKKAIWVSIFPDNTTDYYKEQQFQLYGKLKTIPGMEHPLLDMYSTRIELEEI